MHGGGTDSHCRCKEHSDTSNSCFISRCGCNGCKCVMSMAGIAARAKHGFMYRHALAERTASAEQSLPSTLDLSGYGCVIRDSMTRLGLRCALLALAICAGSSAASTSFDPHEPSGEVVQLTDENFDRLTDCELPWFIAVTAPWCGNCMAQWVCSVQSAVTPTRQTHSFVSMSTVQVHALSGSGTDMAGGGAALERGGARREGKWHVDMTTVTCA